MLDQFIAEPTLEKSQVKASFNRAAERYDDWAALQRRVGDRLLGLLDLPASSTATILDLGTGTGYCARQLIRPNTQVIALDLAPAMLTKARSLNELDTDYVGADAESLPFADRCLDLVFSNLMIQWCVNLDRLFSEVHRVLKPGGIFVFSTFGPETLHELRDAWKRVDFSTHVNQFFGRSAIQDAIVRSGLKYPDVARECWQVDYPNVMNLMRELKGIGAHNVTGGRARTLTGKSKIARMINTYSAMNDGRKIPATFELILGHCGRYDDSRIV